MALHILFLQICVGILALPIHILAFLGLWSSIVKKALPYLLEKMTKSINTRMGEQKRDLFSHLKDFKPPSGELRVLEIGCGTGANFQFYPPGCKVTLVDPNPNFKTFLSKSLSENDHVKFDSFLVASGEDMSQVASGSQDVVICTLVLCSVHNIDKVLAEVKRVLKPAGGFFFLEHVRGDRSSWIYFFQQILDPTWIYIGDGCRLTHETWKNLENANFSEVKLRHIKAPFKWSPVQSHIIGYAVK
ncbi:thiol S-methyltransferase TMT1A-like [Pelobates fuscus]|uniref:thiol S-methyltransferase TMT1A-like n=1 Tax=Pelobates fuscus TaxID=191477 RepID=UPI002FE4F061